MMSENEMRERGGEGGKEREKERMQGKVRYLSGGVLAGEEKDGLLPSRVVLG